MMFWIEYYNKQIMEGKFIIKEIIIKNVHIFREFNFVYLQEDEFIDPFVEFCCENIN
jgi:hypothetical protein